MAHGGKGKGGGRGVLHKEGSKCNFISIFNSRLNDLFRSDM